MTFKLFTMWNWFIHPLWLFTTMYRFIITAWLFTFQYRFVCSFRYSLRANDLFAIQGLFTQEMWFIQSSRFIHYTFPIYFRKRCSLNNKYLFLFLICSLCNKYLFICLSIHFMFDIYYFSKVIHFVIVIYFISMVIHLTTLIY